MLHSPGPQQLAQRWIGPIRVPPGDLPYGCQRREGIPFPKISSYEYDVTLGLLFCHMGSEAIQWKPSRCKQQQEFDRKKKKIESCWYGLNPWTKSSLKSITPWISQFHDSKHSLFWLKLVWIWSLLFATERILTNTWDIYCTKHGTSNLGPEVSIQR